VCFQKNKSKKPRKIIEKHQKISRPKEKRTNKNQQKAPHEKTHTSRFADNHEEKSKKDGVCVFVIVGFIVCFVLLSVLFHVFVVIVVLFVVEIKKQT
jgi:predicted RND superfamily exporter protein